NDNKRSKTLREVVQKHDINHLIVSGLSFETSQQVVGRLWGKPRNPTRLWTPVYMDGRTAIFGLTPPGTKPANTPLAAYAFQPEALAFATNAPEGRQSRETSGRTDGPSFWRELWFGPRPRSIDRDTSAMLVAYSQFLRGQSENYYYANIASWEILSLAGPVGTAAVGNYTAQTGLAMKLMGFSSNALGYDRRLGPPAAALLAVRAAHRAVAENPQDVHAYLALANSLEFLWGAEEQNWSHGQELSQLRQIQRVAALRKALALATKPSDLIEIHSRLAIAYFQMGIIDLSSEHDNKALELLTAAGRNPKESQEDFQKRIDQFKSIVKAREEGSQLEVQRSKYQLANRQSNSRARRASEAVQRRLYQEALKVLIDNDEAVDLEPNQAR